MIRDLSATLQAILSDPSLEVPFPELHNTQIAFDRPDDSFKPERTTIDLFLFDIRENMELRSNEPVIERLNGQAVIYRPPWRVPGNAVSAVTGIGWGKAYNPNALYGKLSERMEQYKSEGMEQSEQESERWRRSVYIPEPPGAKPQVGFSPQSLEGRLWGFVDKNMNREPQFLFNSLHVQQGARDTDIPAFTEFRLIDVSSGKAVLDVKGTQYHITNLAELAYAMGLQ